MQESVQIATSILNQIVCLVHIINHQLGFYISEVFLLLLFVPSLMAICGHCVPYVEDALI